jgi:biopolymer transport protein ExbD
VCKPELPGANEIEVDMVPLIDIVSLLLMFLIIVGDTTKSNSSVQMTLPRADQARKELTNETAGRIVVQLAQDKKTGTYCAMVENRRYELVADGRNKTLIDFLNALVTRRVNAGEFKRGAHGEVDFPVKLRIPEDAPMTQVEKLVQTLAQAKLVNVHYAAAKEKSDKP